MGNGAIEMWSYSPMEYLQTQSELVDMNQGVSCREDSKRPWDLQVGGLWGQPEQKTFQW